MTDDLVSIALVFLRIGLLAFGGSTGALPELQRQLVYEHAWLTPREFADSFALGQLTPGPALLMVMFVGQSVAGIPGAVVALVCIFLPSAVLTCGVTASWQRLRQTTWLAPAQRAFAAVALGLTAAGAYSIVRVTITDVTMLGIGAGAFVLLWRWNFPPALVILLGGMAALIIGMTGRT
jgi:chromate transporter